MPEIKWIKITTNMFDDEKIGLIESMPESDTLLIIWIKLLTLAGKTNANGYIYLTENIPYSDEMLSAIIRRPLNTIRLALQTFTKFKMIDNDDKGIYISNWGKHQSVDQMDKIREDTRNRVAKFRDKQRLLQICNVTETLPVTQNVTLRRRYKNKEEDIRIKTNNTMSSENKFSELVISLTKLLIEYILKNNPNNIYANNPNNLNKWACDVDKMIRLDNRNPEDIKKVIDYSQNDSFWKANILSTSKLRKQYDQLWLKMNNNHNKSSQNADIDKLNKHTEEFNKRYAGIINNKEINNG